MVVVKSHQVRSRRNDFRETLLVAETLFVLIVLIFRSFGSHFCTILAFRFLLPETDPVMKKKGYGVIGLMLALLVLTSFFAGRYFPPVASSGASVALVNSQTQAFTRGAELSGVDNACPEGIDGEEYVQKLVQLEEDGEVTAQFILNCLAARVIAVQVCRDGPTDECRIAVAAEGVACRGIPI